MSNIVYVSRCYFRRYLALMWMCAFFLFVPLEYRIYKTATSLRKTYTRYYISHPSFVLRDFCCLIFVFYFDFFKNLRS